MLFECQAWRISYTKSASIYWRYIIIIVYAAWRFGGVRVVVFFMVFHIIPRGDTGSRHWKAFSCIFQRIAALTNIHVLLCFTQPRINHKFSPFSNMLKQHDHSGGRNGGGHTLTRCRPSL
ncbi:hypothetical protein MN608_08147 [Microdochium nivale]|nr:hypothetical protein MN608_08147 [Microdochium nivale]